jgi:hypothetical protein
MRGGWQPSLSCRDPQLHVSFRGLAVAFDWGNVIAHAILQVYNAGTENTACSRYNCFGILIHARITRFSNFERAKP